MRTSEDVYNRVRWDPSFDPTRFVIGYEARRDEPKEIRLADFAPGGEIPWHRVLYFKADDHLVWDRRSQLDRIFSEPATDKGRRADPLRPLTGGFFSERPSFRHDDGAWVVGAAPRAPLREGAPLRVVTYNVLFDIFEAEHIATARRIPALCEELRRADADVIALQEVQAPLWRALLAEPWVRAAYLASDTPQARTLDPSGVALLCRAPLIQLGWHAYSDAKQALAAVLDLGERRVIVATVHLTSDYAEGAAAKRAVELEGLLTALGASDDDVVLLGDFNVSDEGTPEALPQAGFVDAWRRLHPGDPGYTFDPEVNPLARVMSRSGRRCRLDRVFTRGACRALGVERIGMRPIDPAEPAIFPSDHFGLRAEIGLERAAAQALDAAPTHRTALAWIPLEEAWPPIQAIRELHDPSFARWPPHVNLLYGFVPEARFAEALPLVAAVAAQHPPLALRLAAVRWFEHPESKSAWLAPEPAEPLRRLQADLERCFPRCLEQSSREGFTPHLTLAKLPGGAEVPRALTRDHAIEVRAGRVALLSRRGDEPFAVRAEVELGSGEVHRPRQAPLALSAALARAGVDEPRERARRAEELLARLGRLGGRVEALGSRRLGTVTAASDLDVLWLAHGEARALTAQLARDIGEPRVIEQAAMSLLELDVGGLSVDVALCVCPAALALEDAVAAREALGNPPPLCAAADADALLAHVAEGAGVAAFRELARAVKCWARARGLHDNGFGFLSGLGWSVMAARVCREAPAGEPLASLLQRFFECYGAWSWAEPIALAGSAAPVSAAPLQLLAPASPPRNIARNVTRATLEVLQEELYDAYEAFHAGGHALGPPDLHARHAHALQLSLRATTPAALSRARGWLRGHVLSLLLDLEDLGVEGLRPWPEPWSTGAYLIGLGRAAPPEELARASARLIAAFDVGGASLEATVVPMADLPTL